MRKSLTTIILAILVWTSCTTNSQQKPTKFSNPQTSAASKSESLPEDQKAQIDSLLSQNKGTLTVLVKLPGNQQLVEVKGEQWPDEVEITYNILKDSSGQVLMFAESPFSESGDWNISLIHYFDEAGKTFAFSKRTNFFNSGCTEGVAYETITEYFDQDFRKVGEQYSLLDGENNKLDKGKCEFPYEAAYKVLPNLDACMQTINGR